MSRIQELAKLLRLASEAHHEAEKRLPPHDWQDWYSAYISLRADGQSECAAARDADRYVQLLLKEQRP